MRRTYRILYSTGNIPDTLVGLFTVTTSDIRVHINEHGLNNNDKVRFQLGIEAGNVLPTRLIAGTYYFVVGSRINDFQVSLSSGGSALRITDTGVGTTNEVWKQ